MSKRQKKGRLGDRLFAEDAEYDPNAFNTKSTPSTIKKGITPKKNQALEKLNPSILKMQEILKEVKSQKAITALIAKENPEMIGLVEEFQFSLEEIKSTLQPILQHREQSTLKKTENKSVVSYLEMKHNLLLQYCTYLSFYLLLKVEGKSTDQIKEHPVLFKITNIKQLLNGLTMIQEKLEKPIKKMIKAINAQKAKKDKAERKVLKAKNKKQRTIHDDDENESEINMDDYDVEQVSDPDNEVYSGDS